MTKLHRGFAILPLVLPLVGAPLLRDLSLCHPLRCELCVADVRADGAMGRALMGARPWLTWVDKMRQHATNNSRCRQGNISLPFITLQLCSCSRLCSAQFRCIKLSAQSSKGAKVGKL